MESKGEGLGKDKIMFAIGIILFFVLIFITPIIFSPEKRRFRKYIMKDGQVYSMEFNVIAPRWKFWFKLNILPGWELIK